MHDTAALTDAALRSHLRGEHKLSATDAAALNSIMHRPTLEDVHAICHQREAALLLGRLNRVLDRLDVEEDEAIRSDLLDEAIGLADADPVCADAWAAYR